MFSYKWSNKSPANIVSNFRFHLPTETVKRRVKSETDAPIIESQLIKQYYNSMGGIDAIDRLLGSYCPTVRGKKWYWPLIINAVNVSVVAPWQFHYAVVEVLKSHLEFRCEIAIRLLKSAINVHRKTTGRAIANLPSDLWYEGISHCRVSTTQDGCKICQKILVICGNNVTFVFTQTKM